MSALGGGSAAGPSHSRHFAALRNLVVIGHSGLWPAERPVYLWVHGLITFALLLVSQFVGHRPCAHRRNAELCLDIDLVSVGDRIDVLIIVLQMGCWELGD